MSFIDLHVHTCWSLLDGIIKIKPLMEKCKALNRDSVAITDHGTLGGLVEFHGAAVSAGIKPLLGAEFYHEKGGENCHLVLIARNREGYRHLVRINNASQDNFYRKPRVTDEMLRDSGGGLILLTACVQGWMAKSVLAGTPDWDWFRAVQGWVDYAFLEVQNHGLPEEAVVFNAYENSSFRNLMVGTTDAHYLEASDARAHSVGLAVAMNKREGEFKFNGTGYHVRPEPEILLPQEVLDRTREVAALVEPYDLGYDTWQLPEVELDPEGELAELEFRLNDYLTGKFNFVEDLKFFDEYWERLEYEFRVIKDNNFLPYFKIVSEICKFVDGRGKLRGWGRGSASGSLIAMLYGITKVDPIEWGLFFERFLNPDRISPPDIDLDFQPEDREPVIEWMRQKYGRVYQIGTYTSLGSKEVIVACSRAMGVSTRLGEFIPVEAPVPPISEIIIRESFAAQVKKEGNEELMAICIALEGLPRNRSAHASGVVIDVMNELPFQISKSGANAGLPVTSYDMYSLEGGLKTTKIDILGVNALAMIDRTCKAVGIRVEDFPLDDVKSFESFNAGNMLGIFQFETHSFAKIIKELHPDTFEELVDLNTLGRPGCLESGMTDEYISRKFGRSDRRPIHSSLEDDGHQGLPLFQEQMMKIARDLAGFTMAEADTLRKAIGKKQKDLMDSLKQKFIDGAALRGVPPEESGFVWETLEKSARYTWNLSHAVAYTLMSYWTMYLSANHPVEYFCEMLNGAGDAARRRLLLSECNRRKIPVEHPLINEAERECSVKDGKVLLGLAGIKFVGESTLDSIMKARASGPFRSSADLKVRTKADSRKVEYLLKAGAFPLERVPGRDDEVEALGYSISGRATDQGWYKYVSGLGEVLDVRKITTKKGDPMSFVTVDFHDGVESVTVFPRLHEQYRDVLVRGAVLGFRLDGDVLTGLFQVGDVKEYVVSIPEGKADEFLSFFPSCGGRPNVRAGNYSLASMDLTEETLGFIEREFGIVALDRL